MNDTLIFVPVKLENTHIIKRLLDSLETNKYFDNKDYGVVVVDDGCSTSDVKKLCSEYPVTYLRTDGVGKMAALNYALKNTSSKYVAFVDQDNIILSPDWLKTLKSNFTSDKVGYVSGKVKLFNIESDVQTRWEKKGALNKGDRKLILGKDFFNKFRLRGVPVNLCTAGSNHVMPRKVLEKIGFHDERFGPGAFVDGAGGDLDITYKVLRNGFTAIYDPTAVNAHEHPKTFSSLKNKMFSYGISDTAIHLKFLFEFGDIRSFFQIFYRIGQNTLRFMRSFTGSYPLPPNVSFASILGNFAGIVKYFQLRLVSSTLKNNTH
ncbi:MAG: glycosyl transferase family 2 [uncultured bacterium]|uniref:Glycosyltransferase 2-like domain-containing protein n=1 Tax=Candidatus Woesebacteria bacterium GW2011_GWA1_40_43 TaxID=1618553 RepID=A0A0G0SG15_9BACT|nr:MAG: glycosyl transferase family 2 [uncultured bacterium]KKR52062.1 MAG: hypothetical protein UT88_C0025G0006 [Candidatus Woesebacteria bacterium GW2011_GWD2_40_19]KKR57851.1 MAG: hypothetical protein UT96_C0013G0010 [Candidatus Woesebacteria bacterium GW2011_GWC2_40_30]KKR63724.1 MAG: hypothetical protein UU02_C0020G0004 [Candidatus Woesebacteria bacterium GW2011_GWA1_40_43]HAU65475.1 hypothetical protein [Candidatus Woesebacteria bacterium]